MKHSIAHIRSDDHRVQSVEEHLIAVKNLCENYGEKIGLKHIAGLAGMLHDLGKYSKEFQNYIIKAVKQSENAPKRGSVDHSTAGGKLLYIMFHFPRNSDIYSKLLVEIVSNAIVSHHSYLLDYLTVRNQSPFLTRMNKEIENFNRQKKLFFKYVMDKDSFIQYVQKAIEELKLFLTDIEQDELKFTVMFITKYVFSCLIDADRNNARIFLENDRDLNEVNRLNINQKLFARYYKNLKEKLKSFEQASDSTTTINRLRSKMSDQCERFAVNESGVYTLSIPTGGGKTLASFRYALKHALKFDKERIIYVVPYTTIIEQNADEIRRIIKDDQHLLEHHSNIVLSESINEEDIYQSQSLKKLLLAKDNWDSPIIFTTMVQFLNTFYELGSRNIRRLHNLSRSVIIFDEVQKVPTHCVSLFNRTLNFLNKKANATILLCTATQPALDYVEHRLEMKSDAEMIESLPDIKPAFKRVKIVDLASNQSFERKDLVNFITSKIKSKSSMMIVLNTKKAVKDLYNDLKNNMDSDISLYHLSTSMCAAHRNSVLKRIKDKLENKVKVVCISTQLIEAGVDISFHTVVRSIAGLDSIIQAAGRCNRHGEHDDKGKVYIINYSEENLQHLKEIDIGRKITKQLLIDIRNNPKNHGGDLLSDQAIKRYFTEFYNEFRLDLDYYIDDLALTMIDLLARSRERNHFYHSYLQNKKEEFPLVLTQSYHLAAEKFKVIDAPTTSVLVPFDRGKDYIAQLVSSQKIEDHSKILKKIQRYTINVYEHELEILKKNDRLKSILDNKIIVLKEGVYSEDYGLGLDEDLPLDFYLY